MHIDKCIYLDKRNSLGKKFWSVHEFMQICYLFRSSGTGSLKSRINKRHYIFSVFKNYKTILHEIHYRCHDRKETECNGFSSGFIFSSFWSYYWEEWNWLPWQSNNLGLRGTWLVFWKVYVLQGYVTIWTKEKEIVLSFTSPSFACNSHCSKAFELPSVLVKICHVEKS